MTNEEGQEYYNETVPMPKKTEMIGGDKDHIAAVLAYHGIDFVKQLEAAYARWNNPPSEALPEGAGIVLKAATRIRDLEVQLKQANDAGFNEGVEAAAVVVPLIYQKAISQLKRTQP